MRNKCVNVNHNKIIDYVHYRQNNTISGVIQIKIMRNRL